MLTAAQHEDLRTKYKQGLLSLCGDRLMGVHLFGSSARNGTQPGSEVDILIVARAMISQADEIRRSRRLKASRSLRHGIGNQPVYPTAEAWREGRGERAGALRTEAVTV